MVRVVGRVLPKGPAEIREYEDACKLYAKHVAETPLIIRSELLLPSLEQSTFVHRFGFKRDKKHLVLRSTTGRDIDVYTISAKGVVRVSPMWPMDLGLSDQLWEAINRPRSPAPPLSDEEKARLLASMEYWLNLPEFIN